LDLVGYTRLTEEHGDQVAAELAETLAVLVNRSSSRARCSWRASPVQYGCWKPAGRSTCR